MSIPENFEIPTHIEFEIADDCYILIIPLNHSLAAEDYALIIENKDHLKGLFGELDDWWPSENLSQNENYNMLLWHEKQFKKRESFAYSIFLNNRYIGCFYIYGLDEVYKIVSVKDPDLLYVFMWTSENIYNQGIDSLLFCHLKLWIETEWNFTKADYPGRLTPLISFSEKTASWIKTIKT